ncbi:hypothetical protein IFM89_031042 [Coptis chinensis]|uniref:Cytochrome P450 n=1 Tax=Coptis chinensis TaxID=261450 RepID=A0A835H6H2_9MAGN|nr:hypothetical protein IFM89_031042 [Coptis chinensis]
MKQDGSVDKSDFVDILLYVQKNNILDSKFIQENIKALIVVRYLSTLVFSLFYASDKKHKLDEEDIQEMNYLKSIVKETQRIYPPLPLLVPRESSTATNLKGYRVPSKTRVYINTWAIQRDREVWNNPKEFEFSPERFCSDNIVDLEGQDYEYFPFSSGRRGCPGMSLGLVVSEIVIANLLYWFDWELPGGANKEDLDMTEYFGLVVTKKIPLHLVPTCHCFQVQGKVEVSYVYSFLLHVYVSRIDSTRQFPIKTIKKVCQTQFYVLVQFPYSFQDRIKMLVDYFGRRFNELTIEMVFKSNWPVLANSNVSRRIKG